jgi:hypothetical protein
MFVVLLSLPVVFTSFSFKDINGGSVPVNYVVPTAEIITNVPNSGSMVSFKLLNIVDNMSV